MSRSNRKVVPECAHALNQMKYEIAAELGLVTGGSAHGADTEFASELGGTAGAGGAHVNWSQIATRDAGFIGGGITRRLVQHAEQV